MFVSKRCKLSESPKECWLIFDESFPKISGYFFFINCRIVNLRFFISCYICTHWQYHVHCDFDFQVTSEQVHDTFSWAIFDPSISFLLFYSHFWTGHESRTIIWTDGHRERRVEMKLCWHYNEILCISLSLIRLVESRVCGNVEGGGWVGHTSTNNKVLLFSFKGERV